MTTMTKKIGIQFIIGVMVGFMLNANHHKRRNVVSYDKYLICPAVMDSPFGQPKCYISNEMYIAYYFGHFVDRKSTRLNSSHSQQSRMPSSA